MQMPAVDRLGDQGRADHLDAGDRGDRHALGRAGRRCRHAGRGRRAVDRVHGQRPRRGRASCLVQIDDAVERADLMSARRPSSATGRSSSASSGCARPASAPRRRSKRRRPRSPRPQSALAQHPRGARPEGDRGAVRRHDRHSAHRCRPISAAGRHDRHAAAARHDAGRLHRARAAARRPDDGPAGDLRADGGRRSPISGRIIGIDPKIDPQTRMVSVAPRWRTPTASSGPASSCACASSCRRSRT